MAGAQADDLLSVAVEAAERAGELLAARFRAGGETSVHAKSTPTDLASEADLAAERAIVEVLDARRPGDSRLAEEGGGELRPPGAGELRWLVDPLDGTINFLFRIPHWCVSVACEDADGMVAGVVFDPLRGELFSATRDGDAALGNRSLGGSSSTRRLEESLVATGFAYDPAVRERQGAVMARLAHRARDVRRMGSAALDLAWTAAGRYDAYYERTVQPWDVAAGALICRRAGLEIRDLAPRDGLPGGIAAGPAALLDELDPFEL